MLSRMETSTFEAFRLRHSERIFLCQRIIFLTESYRTVLVVRLSKPWTWSFAHGKIYLHQFYTKLEKKNCCRSSLMPRFLWTPQLSYCQHLSYIYIFTIQKYWRPWISSKRVTTQIRRLNWFNSWNIQWWGWVARAQPENRWRLVTLFDQRPL